MKQSFFTVLIAVLIINLSYAQSDDFVRKSRISFYVVVPDYHDELNQKCINLIKGKMIKLITTHGIAGEGYNNDFVIYPIFEVINIEEINTSFSNQYKVESSLSLVVKQVSNMKVYGIYEFDLRGYGSNEKNAIISSINKMKTNNNEIESFINSTKDKIVSYYDVMCDNIISEANNLANKKKYESALIKLGAVPATVSTGCYKNITKKSAEIFKKYQNIVCKSFLSKAKASAAKKEYIEALDYVVLIDPESICGTEAKKFISTVSKKVDAEHKKDFDLALKKYNDKTMLEKFRTNAKVEIAKSYNNRTHPVKNITYKSLF